MDRRKFIEEAFKAIAIWLLALIFLPFAFQTNIRPPGLGGDTTPVVTFVESAAFVCGAIFLVGIVVFVRAAHRRYGTLGLPVWIARIPAVWAACLTGVWIVTFASAYGIGMPFVYMGQAPITYFLDWHVLIVGLMTVFGVILPEGGGA